MQLYLDIKRFRLTSLSRLNSYVALEINSESKVGCLLKKLESFFFLVFDDLVVEPFEVASALVEILRIRFHIKQESEVKLREEATFPLAFVYLTE